MNIFFEYLTEKWKYIVLSAVITLLMLFIERPFFTLQQTDLYIYLAVSKDTILNGFVHTYSYSFWIIQGMLPYRYLPSLLLIFSPIAFIPIEWSFAIYFAINMILVVLCGFLMKNILILLDCAYQPGSRLNFIINLLFFVYFPMEAITIGQVSVIVGTVLLASFYAFLRKNYAAGSLLLGFVFIIKPVFITLALLIIIGLDRKGLIKRAICIVIVLVPDAIIFLLNRNALHDFISLNIAGFTQNWGRFNSISLMNLALLAGDNSTGVLEGIAIVLCTVFGMVMANRQKNENDKLLLVFTIGVVSYIVTFADAWTNQDFYIYAFLFIYIAKVLQNNHKRLMIIFLYTFINYLKLYISLLSAYLIRSMIPSNFEELAWSDAYAIIISSPLLVFNMILTIIACVLSLLVFISLQSSKSNISNSPHLTAPEPS